MKTFNPYSVGQNVMYNAVAPSPSLLMKVVGVDGDQIVAVKGSIRIKSHFSRFKRKR